MRDAALSIEQLTVEVEGREILHNINLGMKLKETHVLFGPNGSGKTTM
jgi:Fe-S cluster assembly ATP-binding protein